MKTEAANIKKLSRLVKVLLWLGGALVVYAIVGVLVAPAVIKARMLKSLPVLLHRPVAVAQVKVNPFALSLTIRGLAVNENNGAPFAGWDEFYARLKFASFFQHGWAVDEIHLTHPFAAIIREVWSGDTTSTARSGAMGTGLVLSTICVRRAAT